MSASFRLQGEKRHKFKTPTSSTVRGSVSARGISGSHFTCAVAARTLKPYTQLSGTRTRATHQSDIFTSRPRRWPDFHHHQRVAQMIAAARTSKDNFFFKDSKGNTASSESVSGAATSQMRKLPLLLPSEREASAELSRRRKHFL